MARNFTLKNHVKEIQLFNQRLLVMGLISLGLLFILMLRLLYLQVDQHKLYSTLSKKNQLTLLPIPPTRGLIYDREDRIIAQNEPVFNLIAMPKKIKALDDTLEGLQTIVNLTPDDISAFKRHLKQHRRFENVPLKFKLSEEEAARFYANQFQFPGIKIETELVRDYPYGSNLVDVLGYVGRINEKELQHLDPNAYLATNYLGKIGIEKQYENVLHGKIGYQQVETNANGQIVRTLDKMPPTPGNDLHLTIDARLQEAAHKALNQRRGTIVAIQPSTGEILTLASSPTYDPNPFVHGMTIDAYQTLQQSLDRPLFNRAIHGQYALASTIKPFLALEGLKTGLITAEQKFFDPGWYKVKHGKHVYRNWKPQGDGWLRLNKAIVVSNDTYFYDLSYRLGIARIDEIMHEFGFGKSIGLDISGEANGLIPTPEWKLNSQGSPWYPGDTVLSGIGQGFMLATPIQLAAATAALATRGELFQPHFLKEQVLSDGFFIQTEPQPLNTIEMSDEHWQTIIHAMQRVVESPVGTGFRFGKSPYKVAAKTGTAQLVNARDKHGIKKKNLPEWLADNSIFIVFAPVKDPEIAVAVIVENSKAAPKVARDFLDAYFKISN